MRLAVVARLDRDLGLKVATLVAKSAKAAGFRHVTVTADIPPLDNTDVVFVHGIEPRAAFDAGRAAGLPVVIVDKGYSRVARGPLNCWYWRMSINAPQPLAYMQRGRPGDRWRATGTKIATAPARLGDSVIFAGSSQKYCNWFGLGDANAYADEVLTGVAKLLPKSPLIYRPKPSWRGGVPVAGAVLDDGVRNTRVTLQTAMRECRCVVTHGSNASFEALLAGYPAVTLGPGLAAALGENVVADVPAARWPGVAAVTRLAYDAAYHQWTVAEFQTGQAIKEVLGYVEAAR